MRRHSWKTTDVSLGLIAASFFGLAPLAVHAAPIFYTDAATFGAAQPGLASQSFAGLTQGIHANNLAVSEVTFSTQSPGQQSSALDVYGSSIGNNWFGDTLVLTFSPTVTAVGAQIVSEIGEQGASPVSAPITERVYSGATLLGARTVTEASGFFGVASATSITSITLFSDCDVDCSTFVSNLSLGAASTSGGSGGASNGGGQGGTAAVPEPASFASLLAGLAAAAFSAGRWRRCLPPGRPRPPAERRRRSAAAAPSAPA